MSQIISPTRFGPHTTATVLNDLTTERSVLSRACANVESSVRKIARLATERGGGQPTLGYHGALLHPEAIDHAALTPARDEALRDAQHRLTALQDLIASLIGAR